MTPEQKLDRLERIARLMLKAGLRARKHSREQDEKINMIINAQIKNEEMFAQNEVRFAENEERFAKNEERFARNEERFAKHEKSFFSEMRQRDERFGRFVKFVMDKQILNEERFGELAEAQIELAASQVETNHRFDVLIDVIREGRNGRSA